MVRKTSLPSAQTKIGSKLSGCCLFTIPIAIFVGVVNITSIPIKYVLAPANHKYARPLAVISLLLFGCLGIGLSSISGQPITNTTSTPTFDIKTLNDQVMQTALASYTQTLAAIPTNTTLPTATLALSTETSTPVPTQTQIILPTATIYIAPTIFIAPTLPLQSAVCSCSGDSLNCSDFASHSSAQACYNYCISQGRGDIHGLDANGDGDACESLR